MTALPPSNEWALLKVDKVLFGVNIGQIFDIKRIDITNLYPVKSKICPFLFIGPDSFPIACLDLLPLLFPRENESTHPSDIILLKDHPFWALLVSEICDIISLRIEELAPLPPIARKVRLREAVVGIGFYKELPFYVLDLGPKRLLNAEEEQEVRRVMDHSPAYGQSGELPR